MKQRMRCVLQLDGNRCRSNHVTSWQERQYILDLETKLLKAPSCIAEQLRVSHGCLCIFPGRERHHPQCFVEVISDCLVSPLEPKSSPVNAQSTRFVSARGGGLARSAHYTPQKNRSRLTILLGDLGAFAMLRLGAIFLAHVCALVAGESFRGAAATGAGAMAQHLDSVKLDVAHALPLLAAGGMQAR